MNGVVVLVYVCTSPCPQMTPHSPRHHTHAHSSTVEAPQGAAGCRNAEVQHVDRWRSETAHRHPPGMHEHSTLECMSEVVCLCMCESRSLSVCTALASTSYYITLQKHTANKKYQHTLTSPTPLWKHKVSRLQTDNGALRAKVSSLAHVQEQNARLEADLTVRALPGPSSPSTSNRCRPHSPLIRAGKQMCAKRWRWLRALNPPPPSRYNDHNHCCLALVSTLTLTPVTRIASSSTPPTHP